MNGVFEDDQTTERTSERDTQVMEGTDRRHSHHRNSNMERGTRMDTEKRSAHDFENTPKTWGTVVDWVTMAKPGHSLSGLRLGYGWVRACSLGG